MIDYSCFYPLLDDSVEFTSPRRVVPSDSDLALFQSVNDELDKLLPFDPVTGKRSSDVEVLQNTDNKVLFNTLMSRLVSEGDFPVSSFKSDDDLMNTVIPRNLTLSDFTALVNYAKSVSSPSSTDIPVSSPVSVSDLFSADRSSWFSASCSSDC